MNIQISCDHYPLTDRTRRLIDDKLSLKLDRLLSRFDNDVKVAQLNIQRNKIGVFKVTFDMSLPGHEHVYASSQHLLLRSAIIHLEHQVTRQLEKYKSETLGH